MNISEKDTQTIVKIDFNTLSDVCMGVVGEELKMNQTYEYQGFDELDLVEVVMNLERELNISISDELATLVFDSKSKPSDLLQWSRNLKIENLGINE